MVSMVFHEQRIDITEDATREFNRARGEASTTLMADIVSGKGPDVLLDGSDYMEIQSPKYLVDLKGKIDELKLNKDEYFLHVFEMAELEGKEYFLPLQFSLSGFLLTEEIAENRKGVKITDYQSFVQTIYNGNDPLFSLADRTTYFNYLLGNSFDLFIGEDGKYDFDNSAFREIA
jgi:ABC-type glycerol-3-phosphate transport system substrate-binding protein